MFARSLPGRCVRGTPRPISRQAQTAGIGGGQQRQRSPLCPQGLRLLVSSFVCRPDASLSRPRLNDGPSAKATRSHLFLIHYTLLFLPAEPLSCRRVCRQWGRKASQFAASAGSAMLPKSGNTYPIHRSFPLERSSGHSANCDAKRPPCRPPQHKYGAAQ